MEPISAIVTALSGIKTATEIAQLLKTSDDAYSKAESKLKIAELMNALADTKIAISELKELIQQRDEKITSLMKDAKERDTLIFVDPIYRRKIENGELEGYYCPRCYDVDSKLVRLVNHKNDSYYCNQCKNTYYGPNYSIPRRRVPNTYDPFNY